MEENNRFLNENILNNPTKLLSELDDFNQVFFIYQKDILNEFVSNINNKKIFIFKGSNNSNKSYFKPIIKNILDENIFVFEYNCCEITTLDDIFLSLNDFFNKTHIKNDFDNRIKTNFKTISIDEKIIGFLKKNSKKKVFIFDNLNYLLDENNEFISEDIKSFFQLLNSLSNIKLIFLTNSYGKNILNSENDDEIILKIFPFDEEAIPEIFKKLNVSFPSYLLPDFYEATLGEAFLLEFILKSIQILNLPLSELFKESQSVKADFIKHIFQKIYNIIPNETKKILFYIISFRSPVNISVIKAIDNFSDVEKNINFLKKILFIENTEELTPKRLIKEFMEQILSDKEKATLHNKLSQFYSEQIPLSPSDRLINLSRTTMYSEKFFHQNNIKKLNNKNSTKFFSNFSDEKLTSEKIKYVASISHYMPILNVDIEKDKTEKQQIITNNEENQKNDKSNEENIDINIDIPDNIELSNEEKKLLMLDDKEDDDILQDDNNIEKHLTYEPFTHDNSPENIKPEEDDEETIRKKKGLELYFKGMDLLNNNDNSQESIGYFRSALGYLDNNDTDNFYRTILALAKALSDNFNFDEAKEYLERIVYATIDISQDIKIKATLELANINDYEKNLNEAISLYNTAIELAKDLSKSNLLSSVYFKKALFFDDNNDIDNAIVNYSLAIEYATKRDEEDFLAAVYSNLGAIKKERKQYKEALDLYKKALFLDEKFKNQEGKVNDFSNIADILLKNGKYDMAIKSFIMATKISKETEDNYLIASSYLELGDAFLSHRDYKNALKSYILSKKNIDETISTDSKNKIELRFKTIYDEIGEAAYKFLLKELKLL